MPSYPTAYVYTFDSATGALAAELMHVPGGCFAAAASPPCPTPDRALSTLGNDMQGLVQEVFLPSGDAVYFIERKAGASGREKENAGVAPPKRSRAVRRAMRQVREVELLARRLEAALLDAEPDLTGGSAATGAEDAEEGAWSESSSDDDSDAEESEDEPANSVTGANATVRYEADPRNTPDNKSSVDFVTTGDFEPLTSADADTYTVKLRPIVSLRIKTSGMAVARTAKTDPALGLASEVQAHRSDTIPREAASVHTGTKRKAYEDPDGGEARRTSGVSYPLTRTQTQARPQSHETSEEQAGQVTILVAGTKIQRCLDGDQTLPLPKIHIPPKRRHAAENEEREEGEISESDLSEDDVPLVRPHKAMQVPGSSAYHVLEERKPHRWDEGWRARWGRTSAGAWAREA